MSDLGRKPLTDQVSETITPDSQKSVLDKAKEATTDTADSIAGAVQPGDSKSTSQKLSDETSSTSNTAADKLSAVGQNVQETASNLTQQAQSNAGPAQASAQGYLEQAQKLAANALTGVSDATANLAKTLNPDGKK